jgi:hypothetical protein
MTSLKEYKAAGNELDPTVSAMVESNIEAAETILLCGSHQRSIGK